MLLSFVLILSCFSVFALPAYALSDTFADDATAKSAGYIFRVGAAGGTYYSTMTEAVKNTPANGTLYVLGDFDLDKSKEGTDGWNGNKFQLTKNMTIEGIPTAGGVNPVISIKTNDRLNIGSGGAGNAVTVTLKNVTFSQNCTAQIFNVNPDNTLILDTGAKLTYAPDLINTTSVIIVQAGSIFKMKEGSVLENPNVPETIRTSAYQYHGSLIQFNQDTSKFIYEGGTLNTKGYSVWGYAKGTMELSAPLFSDVYSGSNVTVSIINDDSVGADCIARWNLSFSDNRPVAEVNGTPYTTLNEAIDAVENNGTVKIISDIPIPNTQASVEFGKTWGDSKTFTIDGQNHTVYYYEKVNRPFNFNNCNATMKNITIQGRGSSGLGYVRETASLTLVNTKLEAENSNHGIICVRGTLILDEGTVLTSIGTKVGLNSLQQGTCVALESANESVPKLVLKGNAKLNSYTSVIDADGNACDVDVQSEKVQLSYGGEKRITDTEKMNVTLIVPDKEVLKDPTLCEQYKNLYSFFQQVWVYDAVTIESLPEGLIPSPSVNEKAPSKVILSADLAEMMEASLKWTDPNGVEKAKILAGNTYIAVLNLMPKTGFQFTNDTVIPAEYTVKAEGNGSLTLTKTFVFPEEKADDDLTGTNVSDAPATEEKPKGKSGCKSSISGFGITVVFFLACGVALPIMKKKKHG